MQTSSVNMIKSWVRNENSIINSGKSTEPDLKFWARGNPGPRYLIAQAQLCYKDVITSNYNHCCNYQIMNKNLLKVTLSRLTTQREKLCSPFFFYASQWQSSVQNIETARIIFWFTRQESSSR